MRQSHPPAVFRTRDLGVSETPCACLCLSLSLSRPAIDGRWAAMAQQEQDFRQCTPVPAVTRERDLNRSIGGPAVARKVYLETFRGTAVLYGPLQADRKSKMVKRRGGCVDLDTLLI
ncbi:hypothetical protein LZ31DRAFT_538013 [Colletotrichum somersetense]|nr:hypothetical protein LZ31DRAFT_538013 [Colletotrichum somersetense]